MVVEVDGVQYALESPDVDGDGQRGGIERISMDSGITPIIQPTELGQAMEQSFEDKVDPKTRMTTIDMKTRIFNPWERNSFGTIDSLVAMRFLPSNCLFITRIFKRLNVSMNGEGRKEMVDIIAGKREHDKQMSQGGLFSGLKSLWPGSGGNGK